MTVTAVEKDPEQLTMSIITELDVPVAGPGSCGRTHASSNAGGGHRPIRPRSSTTT